MTAVAVLTIVHVAISLVAIAAGFVIVKALLGGERYDGWTKIFLWTTVLTSATGFLFPVDRVLPSHILGVISLVVLAVAILARYGYRLEGRWRRIYAITAVLAFYLNFFVLIVQAFLKIPTLHALAPNQNEPAFAIAQGAAFVVFAGLTVAAARRASAPAVHVA